MPGAFIIDAEPKEDERGFFSRVWCRREFEMHGLETELVQCSLSFNKRRGTLRGMHFQAAPYEEVKLIRCSRGAIFDVIIDLRPHSPTRTRYVSVVLTDANRRMLYVPRGFAHGFQTLDDDTEIAYSMTEFYHPDHSRGVRWNDPAFGIEWPHADGRIMAVRDETYPDFNAAAEPAA